MAKRTRASSIIDGTGIDFTDEESEALFGDNSFGPTCSSSKVDCTRSPSSQDHNDLSAYGHDDNSCFGEALVSTCSPSKGENSQLTANDVADDTSLSMFVNEAEGSNDDDTKYCICHQGSYGKMVMCDNPHCDFVWFHFRCVALRQTPRGKWYCPKCKRNCKSLFAPTKRQARKKKA